jgi:hypothetical protein
MNYSGMMVSEYRAHSRQGLFHLLVLLSIGKAGARLVSSLHYPSAAALYAVEMGPSLRALRVALFYSWSASLWWMPIFWRYLWSLHTCRPYAPQSRCKPSHARLFFPVLVVSRACSRPCMIYPHWCYDSLRLVTTYLATVNMIVAVSPTNC